MDKLIPSTDIDKLKEAQKPQPLCIFKMRFGVNGEKINIPFNNINGIYETFISYFNNNELKRLILSLEKDNHIHANVEIRNRPFTDKFKKQMLNLFYNKFPELLVSKGAKALTCQPIKFSKKIQYWDEQEQIDEQLSYPFKDIDFNHRSKFKVINYTDSDIQNMKNRHWQLQSIKDKHYLQKRQDKILQTYNNKLKFIEYAEKILKDKICIKSIRNCTISYFEQLGRPFKEYEVYSHYNLLVAKYLPNHHQKSWYTKLHNYDPY